MHSSKNLVDWLVKFIAVYNIIIQGLELNDEIVISFFINIQDK